MKAVQIGDAKYLKTKFTGLDGKTTVGWAEEDSDFELRVTAQGLWFQGTMKTKLSSMNALQDWAQLIGEAWEEHMRLAPKITKAFKETEIQTQTEFEV